LALGLDGPSFGVVMFDLTGFKRVNDEGTHAAGDAALGEVGRTLGELCAVGVSTPLGLPFRYGGDEFCILVPAANFESFVEPTNLSRLRWPNFTLEGKVLAFGAAVGSAPPDEEVGLTVLIERADAASKASKHEKDRPIMWTATLEQKEVFSSRRRCISCSATVAIDVPLATYRADFFSFCANCRKAMS